MAHWCFFQHRCCFFTWCAFTYSGTHLYYCSRLRKLRQQRSSVSFGRLHKEAGAAEALKTEWDRCLHFHSSSIFHEDSSFKHQVKLGVQSKGLNLCSASDVWPEGAPVSLRKIIVEHTHRLEHSRKDAHISCEAPDEGPAIMLHIRRQVAGWDAEQMGGWGNMLREACCQGERSEWFPQSPCRHDGVAAGTLSAVAAAGKAGEENKHGT